MPRIPDVHLRSVAFIYDSEQAANEGHQAGATGFVANYPSGVGNWRIRYIVTNKHVVDHKGHWVRLDHQSGTHTVHIPPDEWVDAPGDDDFALAVLRLPESVALFALPLDSQADDKASFNIGPGDEVYMVGRLIGHGGRVTNNPIARFGGISMMPNALELVRDGRAHDVEAYLIEMRSHAGVSGSPVFVIVPANSFRGVIQSEPTDPAYDSEKTYFRLIGIDTGHLDHSVLVGRPDRSGKFRQVGGLTSHYPSDVAIVAPVERIIELLDRDDLASQRAEFGRELERVSGPQLAVPDVASESAPDEFG